MRQAELDLQFTELKAPVAGRIGDRRVSEGNLVTGGTGGNTTLLAMIVSIDPIRFEFTFDEASFLRYERLGKDGKDVAEPCRRRRSRRQADRRAGFRAPGQDGLRRQHDRARLRHHPRPRPARQPRTACSRPACSAACACPARRPTRRCCCRIPRSAPSRCANSCWWSTPRTSRASNTSRSASWSATCASSRTASAPDDRVIVNGLMRARPGAKVTPQEEQPAPGAGPQAKSN